MTDRPVMILAGGTGGHVFPALAVAEALAARDVPVVWMGTRQGLEARVVRAAGIPLEWIAVRGLRGKGARGWLTAPFMLLRAIGAAFGIMRRARPRSVLGMGGYVAGPGALAARLLGVPLVIHEQNAVAGMTNRRLARLATRVLTGFQTSVDDRPSEWVGNPVRSAIAGIDTPESRYGARQGPARLLVIGGSLGARALNERVPAALARLAPESRPLVRHQAGERTIDLARDAYARSGVEADVVAFVEDMADAYAWADLVVCRAGALTVSEIAAAGVAALFVPYPHAVDDHQRANAEQLVAAGAAERVIEADLTVDALTERLERLLGDRQTLATMAARGRALGRPDAAQRVADICLEVADGRV